jgi:hypothetical protein
LVLTDVSGRPWPAAWPVPVAEVEVSGVPAELGAVIERRAEVEAKERDLFARLDIRPVRAGERRYEVGLPADDQPVIVRRGSLTGWKLLAEHPIRVRQLETMPAVERAEGAEPGTVDASLFGRDFWITVPADLPDHELILNLFAAEWPGIEVHLPVDGGLGADADGQSGRQVSTDVVCRPSHSPEAARPRT